MSEFYVGLKLVSQDENTWYWWYDEREPELQTQTADFKMAPTEKSIYISFMCLMKTKLNLNGQKLSSKDNFVSYSKREVWFLCSVL